MSTGARPTVILGVTGCIAAYKACELARALMRADVRVEAVMTEAATHFVGPLTLRTLTGEPVGTSLWEDPDSAPVHHISLAEEADVVVIAPCTANVIAKLAQGRADDLLTTTVLASEAPLVIAPAMNTHMWRDEATQANVELLRERGVLFVEPGTGDLACGDVGEGRLAEVDEIASAVIAEVERTNDFDGVELLVTAGPTREPLDPVRFLGNPSSGKTGYLIAEEAARRGANVTLVSGPTTLPDPFGVRTVRVTTAEEMNDAAFEAFEAADVVIATAAVSDVRPATVADQKMKKTDVPDSIPLVRNPDILAEMGKKKGERVLVGFAAETYDVVEQARRKLVGKSLDMIVANDVSSPGVGFASDRNAVTIVTGACDESVDETSKRHLATIVLDRTIGLLNGGHERTV